MADNLPINFPIPQQDAIASYSYTDIINGLGYDRFYLFKSGAYVAPADTYYYGLTTDIHSQDGSPQLGIVGATEYNFDSSTFNTPRTLKGTVKFILALSAANANSHLAIRLLKVSGITETEIVGTIYTTGITVAGTGAWYCVESDVTSEVNLGVGDFLRLEVIGSAATTIQIGISPIGETSTLDRTESNVLVPFKVDL